MPQHAKTYLFYDIETSGLNPAFDQILQFAAIRTDEQFNEIKRYQYHIKLNPDTICDPEALITHQIAINKLNNEGMPEYKAIQAIHQLFNTPNTVSIGYNSLGFDDEFLRFAFYRNLLPTYTHQYANGCFRADLYSMVVVFYVFAADLLNWPTVNDKASLKLEAINQANEFVKHGQSHNAMTDVEMTLALAKRLIQYPKMWQYLEKSFQKSYEIKRFNSIDTKFKIGGHSYTAGFMIDGRFANENYYNAVVIYLGKHYVYTNQFCWLRMDLETLSKANHDDFINHVGVINKKFGVPPILLAYQPRFAQYIDQNRQNIINTNLAFLNDNQDLLANIQTYVLNYTYPFVAEADIDTQLYHMGFPDEDELKWYQYFHQASLKKKGELIQNLSGSLRERVRRLLGRFAPQYLPLEDQQLFQSYLERIASFDVNELPVDYKGQFRRSVPETLDKIETLSQKASLTDHQQKLLSELASYLAG